MSIRTLFKSALGAIAFIHKDGTPAHFVDGRYTTDNPEHEDQLKEEIKKGHPFIYIDEYEPTEDPDALTPEQKEIRFLKSQLARLGQSGSAGTVSSQQAADMVATTPQTPEAALFGDANAVDTSVPPADTTPATPATTTAATKPTITINQNK